VRYFIITTVCLGCFATAAQPAGAAAGDLSFVGCLSLSNAGCTSTAPANPLNGAYGAAVSPDGNDVYVAGDNADAISHLRRNTATGALTFVNCIGQAAAIGCTNLSPTDALNGAISPVVSPDGHSVYVVAFGSDVVSHFERNTSTGDLTFVNCIGEGAVGCANLSPTNALDTAAYVAITPDGKGVYTANPGVGFSASAFTRDPGSGNLSFVNCVGQGAAGCTNISPTNALNGAIAIAASPDGKDLYVAAENSNAVAHLSRNASTNALTFANCVGQGAAGCTSVAPTDTFTDAEGVTVSPDGANVYSAATSGDALATLKRNPGTGDLSFVSCLGQGATGCTNLSPTVALDGALGVAVTPDGANAYVTGISGATVASFHRDPAAGGLTFQSCIGQGAAGCTNLAPINTLGNAAYLAISPSGTSVYVPDENGAIAAFNRRIAPVCTSPTVTVPIGKATRVDLPCSDANGDPITRAVGTKPAHGTLSAIDQSTGKLTYTPAKKFSGSDSFSFTSSDGDSGSAAATAKLTVTSQALAKLPRSARVSKGKAKLTLFCPATVFELCKGSLSLEATKRALAAKRKAKPVRLGSKKYSIVAGKQATVVVKLSGRAKRVLSRTGKLKVTAIAVSKDGAGTSATKRGTVKLKGKKKRQ
jgi:DNA-binding beta-propeller fold protein YncE